MSLSEITAPLDQEGEQERLAARTNAALAEREWLWEQANQQPVAPSDARA